MKISARALISRGLLPLLAVAPTLSGADAASAASISGLRLLAKIPVPGMTGTWDHLAADARTARLFANAQDIHSLEVFDLKDNQFIRTITGPFNRNQGAAYLENTGQLAISNGRSGTVTFLNSVTLEPPGKSVGIGLGADLMAYDPAARLLYVDHGGRDSNRGFGAVAIIDADKDELIADIPTDLRPAAMAIESRGSRLFVCVPNANQIAVIDRASRQITGRFDLMTSKKPVSITFDEPDKRLFVLTRTPAQLVVLDSDTGRTVAALPTVDEAEDVFYDAAHRRIYTTGLEGVIHSYRQVSADRYELAAKVPVRPHAGSSLLIPGLNRFVVAVAQHENEAPEIWIYETLP